jgi:hypothetical protein
MRTPALWLLAAALLAAQTACSKPTVPDHDDRPEPQAYAPASPTPLRESMQQPIDKAKTAQAEIDAAAERQRDAIEAATGN